MRKLAIVTSLSIVLIACSDDANPNALLDYGAAPAPAAKGDGGVVRVNQTGVGASPALSTASSDAGFTPDARFKNVDESPPTPTPTPPTPQPGLIPMHMSFRDATGDWLMSRVVADGAPLYRYTAVQYRVLDAPVAGGRELYRCVDSLGTHFQSNRSDCEGVGSLEGFLGYVYGSNPGNGAQRIHRCIGKSGVPIVSTIRVADCVPFILQNIDLGFAMDP